MKDQKDRKGMNNKGFSFVELIIAIAILAIMAGVLAPQLIKYIDSSRKILMFLKSIRSNT
jgi:type IV pilus assembly protein PilA